MMKDPRNSESVPLSVERKYQLLLQISEKISGTLDLGEVLNHLIETARSVVSSDAAGIFVLTQAALPLGDGSLNNLISGIASRGFDNLNPREDPMLRSGKGIVGYAIRCGETVVVPDVRKDPRYIAGRARTLSEIAVPITIGGRVIGALNLESDHLNTYSSGDVEILHFFANAAASCIEKTLLHAELLEKKRIENQLRIAREVQAGLLPRDNPRIPGFDIAGMNLPTWEISGDCFDYIPYADGSLGIAIADVSGKGVPAALIMATFRAALRAQVRNGQNISRIVKKVNSLLWESIGDATFVSAVYGVLDPQNGRFIYSNCGHNPPLLIRPGEPSTQLESGGTALGIMNDMEFETGAITIAHGDTLVLYTDGVIEVSSEKGIEYGTPCLEADLRAANNLPAGDMIRSIIERTQAFSCSRAYSDDFTLVIVKREKQPQPELR
jgi:phosphoserine phosphatase RsbU/P